MNKDTQNTRDKKLKTGIVVKSSTDKMLSVAVYRFVKHPKYNKFLKKLTRFKVHDGKNQAETGDVVKITPCRVLSRTKRWKLAEIVKSVSKKGQDK